MSDIAYAHIAPLVSESTQAGNTMQVVFRCPVSGTILRASAPLKKEDSLGSRVAGGAKRRLGWSLKNALARTVRRAVGYGIAGGVASDAVSGVTDGVMSGGDGNKSYSDAEKQAAIVDAFEGVRSSFAWEPAQGRFISAAAAGATQPDLVVQLEAAPVIAAYDRGVLARMLAEIAAADGQLGDDERSFFGHFITPELGTIDELVARPRLSPAELGETSAGPVRETMLMLTWSLALADREIEAGEVARLDELASGLGIGVARSEELKGFAQCYLVDTSLVGVYASGQRDPAAHAEVVAMGQTIGLTDDAIERVDIRYRKRHGIA